MRKYQKITLLILLSGFFFSNCNTYIWQPVEKQLEGTWIKSPQTNIYEEWLFENGLFYRFYVELTDPITRDSFPSCIKTASGFEIKSHTYEVENKITKHYLVIPDMNLWCASEDNPKWLVVKLTSSEMYLTMVDDRGSKGAYQFGFTKK